MVVDKKILDELSAKAKENPRSGTVLFEAKDGPYEPLGEEDIMK